MKKVVLFVMHELKYGGAERVILNIVNNFNDEKYEVHFCIFKKKGGLLSEINDNVNVHYLHSSRALYGILKLAKLIKKFRPAMTMSSITHVNFILSVIKIMPGFRKYKIGTREVNNPSIRAKHLKRNKRLDFFYKYTIYNLDFVVAQSQFMKQDLIKVYGLNKEKIKVINNPVDTHKIDSKLKEIESKALFDESKVNILAVGGFRAQKNFSFLVEVFKFLDDQYHLTILGEGAEYQKIRRLGKDLNIEEKISLPGAVENPYKYMVQANLFCSTSFYEGFPNVILEANYCGCYALAVKVPGVDEEIIKEGVNGILLRKFDAELFAKAITENSVSKQNRQNIKSTSLKYKAKNIVKRYEKLALL